MAKLTADRDTRRRDGIQFGFEAAEEIFCGAMLAMNASGKVVPASASGGRVVGVARESGAAGDRVRVERGVFNFENDQGAITLADVGSQCVVVDDQTVGKAGGSQSAVVDDQTVGKAGGSQSAVVDEQTLGDEGGESGGAIAGSNDDQAAGNEGGESGGAIAGIILDVDDRGVWVKI